MKKEKPVNNTIIVNQPAKKSFLKALFTGADGKLAVVTLGFLMWIAAVTIAWTEMSLENNKLMELPETVVKITLALGATKVTHKIAEGTNWERVIESITEIFKRKRTTKRK